MSTTSNTNWQVWQNPEVAARFTDRRRGGLLGGDVQIDTMLRLIDVVPRPGLTVLDLGCGDGVLLEAVLTAYPDARGVALDGSTAMIGKARERLNGRGVYFARADFNDPEWTEMLPVKAFDAVVSGFAIHHSEDTQKRRLYTEIYELLAPGGVFVNIEHVASPGALGEELFERAYAESVWRFRTGRGEDVTLDAACEELRTRSDRAANRLAPMETQLGWLREIGFADVDCPWKHFELAVLAGYRPGEQQTTD